MYVLRDTLRVKCENVDKVQHYAYNADRFVLRFFYKHKEGILWCFNRPTVDANYFREVPSNKGSGVIQ
jgi:hypothetical protein